MKCVLERARVPVPDEFHPTLIARERWMLAVRPAWHVQLVRIIEVAHLKILFDDGHKARAGLPTGRAYPVSFATAYLRHHALYDGRASLSIFREKLVRAERYEDDVRLVLC